MFCIVAFIILSLLGIFSATHRELAKESFDCVFRRVTFRPCTTGFKEKMQAKLIGKLINKSERLAKFVNKYFELISWVFFMAMLVSTFWSVKGIYNFYRFGSCNGLNETGFCVFDPAGTNNQVTNIQASCSEPKSDSKTVSFEKLDVNVFPQLKPEAKNQIIFMGCYACEYTRKTYPLIKKLADQTKSNLVFVHVPAKEKTDFISKYVYCANKEDKDKFWKLNDDLFSPKFTDIENEEKIKEAIKNNGYDLQKVLACTTESSTQEQVTQQTSMINKTGIYGTPTVIINGEVFVGPKPLRVYKMSIK